MTVKLDLTPEIEAGLPAQAQAEGLPLEQFLQRKLETIVHTSVPKPQASKELTEAWEQGLDKWFDSFPQQPALPEQAFHRENWYSDRW
jgi:hypothetical protein